MMFNNEKVSDSQSTVQGPPAACDSSSEVIRNVSSSSFLNLLFICTFKKTFNCYTSVIEGN